MTKSSLSTSSLSGSASPKRIYANEINLDGLPKILCVTGGSLSGLGKGTCISSIGVCLRSMGLNVTAIKIDPYLNVDAGTMSPYEHGEVYVLEDGCEVDLDLGNYERFLNISLSGRHNITSGKIYKQVLHGERKGMFLGKTVQVVPHVTDAIQEWICTVAREKVSDASENDVCLIEVGGTVGDIESAVYLEALQQLQSKLGPTRFCMCHVSFVPVVGEQKTKPTQNSVRELRQAGLRPNFILCRCTEPVNSVAKTKIAMFTQVPFEHVISVHNVTNIYRVPLLMSEQNLGRLLVEEMNLQSRISPDFSLPLLKKSSPVNLNHWHTLADRMDRATKETNIGIVGKYTGNRDSYLSVVKALIHAGMEADRKMKISWIESSDLEEEMKAENPTKYKQAWEALRKVDGVLTPGGFGDRGILGKAASARYCRETKKPYFGICLGMQTAVIDFARSVLGMSDANSEEFDPDTKHKCIVFMPETVDKEDMGGTMRLGSRATVLNDSNSLIARLYANTHPIDMGAVTEVPATLDSGSMVIFERHRHRYEVNPDMVQEMEAHGLRFTGRDVTGRRMEVLELDGHPFFLGCQSHPEFTSRPIKPNPCFLGFVLASAGKLEKRFQTYDNALNPGAAFLEDLRRSSSSQERAGNTMS